VQVLIVFAMYGNTREVANAMARGRRRRASLSHEAGTPPDDVQLLVVGGPTHMHGLSTSRLSARERGG
jgi:flavodoxin